MQSATIRVMSPPARVIVSVIDMKKAESLLAWACEKMDERYEFLRRAEVRNIQGYNKLSPDEIYAVAAYILNLNGVIGDTDVINAQTLPNVKMPNRDGFITFHRGE